MAKTRLAQRIEAGGSIGRGMVPDGARTRSRSRQGDGVGEVAGARASAMARAIAVDGRDPFSRPFLGRLSRLMRGPCAPSFSACGILAAADCGRGQERSLVARHSLCVLAPQSPLRPPPRAEKRLIFGHETAFWHESGSFRRRVDPVEIADLGFRYEGTRFWSEGAQSLCQNAVSWPKIGQLSACSVRVTTSLGLQMSASARGRACSLRWGKPDKGMPLGAGEGRSRERAKRGDRVGAGGGAAKGVPLGGERRLRERMKRGDHVRKRCEVVCLRIARYASGTRRARMRPRRVIHVFGAFSSGAGCLHSGRSHERDSAIRCRHDQERSPDTHFCL